jgi:hypothetical protein
MLKIIFFLVTSATELTFCKGTMVPLFWKMATFLVVSMVYGAFLGQERVQIDPVMLRRETVQGAIRIILLEIQEY